MYISGTTGTGRQRMPTIRNKNEAVAKVTNVLELGIL